MQRRGEVRLPPPQEAEKVVQTCDDEVSRKENVNVVKKKDNFPDYCFTVLFHP